jgi:predicted dehydrogenase
LRYSDIEKEKNVDKVKIAIVGCGWFANFHLDNLLKMENVEVVAFASGNREKLEAIGKRVPSARLYENHQLMYENEEKIDGVFVCITPNRHESVERLAASYGIHIYVEKPIEVSLERARETARIIQEAGIITSVGYQERYNAEVEFLKKHLQTKKIGLVHGKWIGGMPGVYWWRQKEISGGQIVEQATHIFDMLRYLFGEIDSVYSVAVKGLIEDVENYDIEDASATTLTFASGIVATISTACYVDEIMDYDGVGFQIICSDEVIDYRWNQDISYKKSKLSACRVFDQDAHEQSAKAFIQSIQSNDASGIKSDYSDGLKTLEVTLAANESLASHKPIKLSKK